MSGFKLSDASTQAEPNAATEHGLEQPLGLTVHAIPSPAQAGQADGKRTLVGRWKMLLVLLVCAAPVLASYISYYLIRPEGRRNFGELIDPQRSLPALTITDLHGQPGQLPSLKGQWLLVSVASGACNTACQQNLYLQRQLRESLGKEKDRLDWVWLITDQAPVDPALLPALAQAQIWRVDGQALAKWLEPAPNQQIADHLYVVDPLGNWMMRLPPGLDLSAAAKTKRDLERLMRASAFWDKAGR